MLHDAHLPEPDRMIRAHHEKPLVGRTRGLDMFGVHCHASIFGKPVGVGGGPHHPLDQHRKLVVALEEGERVHLDANQRIAPRPRLGRPGDLECPLGGAEIDEVAEPGGALGVVLRAGRPAREPIEGGGRRLRPPQGEQFSRILAVGRVGLGERREYGGRRLPVGARKHVVGVFPPLFERQTLLLRPVAQERDKLVIAAKPFKCVLV